MGYYNVVKPCVVGKLHYVRPTTAPIKVDDEVAAPLVESGDLTRFGVFDTVDLEGSAIGEALKTYLNPSGVVVAPEIGVEYVKPVEVQIEKPEPRSRGRRKATED